VDAGEGYTLLGMHGGRERARSVEAKKMERVYIAVESEEFTEHVTNADLCPRKS
jgi:archaeosine-15-forming tRNA-guanine transglycosylase